jgi:hypothetical protein
MGVLSGSVAFGAARRFVAVLFQHKSIYELDLMLLLDS